VDDKRLAEIETSAKNSTPWACDRITELVAEVRRLRAELDTKYWGSERHGRDVRAAEALVRQDAKRSERERCSKFLEQSGASGGGDLVMSDEWARDVAAEMRALPDEP
jgi:hypothetical protein